MGHFHVLISWMLPWAIYAARGLTTYSQLEGAKSVRLSVHFIILDSIAYIVFLFHWRVMPPDSFSYATVLSWRKRHTHLCLFFIAGFIAGISSLGRKAGVIYYISIITSWLPVYWCLNQLDQFLNNTIEDHQPNGLYHHRSLPKLSLNTNTTFDTHFDKKLGV